MIFKQKGGGGCFLRKGGPLHTTPAPSFTREVSGSRGGISVHGRLGGGNYPRGQLGDKVAKNATKWNEK